MRVSDRDADRLSLVAEDQREGIMTVLRDRLYKHPDLQMLANRTGISYPCLMNLRSGRTKWPRPNTMFIVVSQLGLSLTLVALVQ